ncbi:MAG TPA: hypothetical protein P5081_14790 [Phycisphaerae bacterium]|nr:hypothetical protein [Phycisphaerae bacterium]HRW54136.1 hypothetical protein [Phycisphaerae bacterium]
MAVTLALVGFATTAVCGLLCDNTYYHLDDVTHYLYAKWAWRWPAYLLDDWGRPGFTVAYALPATLGWTACRIFSALLTALAAWFAYLTARKIDLPRAWLVIPLCYLQPLLFLLSQTTLTETPLAFYLSLAAWLAVTRRWAMSSFVLAAAFVTRHEAIIFLPIWLYFAWRDKARWRTLLPLAWAFVIVNGLAMAFGMSSLIARLLHPTPTTQYGHGGWLTYLMKSLHAFGPVVTILAIVGLRGFLRNPAAKLVAASAGIYFLAETIVFRYGLFASGGYSRFLVAISPLVAILAVNGVNRLLSPDLSVWRWASVGAAAAMALLWIAMERQLVIQHGVILDISETYKAVWVIRITTIALAVIALVAFGLGASDSGRRAGRRLTPVALAVLLGMTLYAFYRPLPKPADAKLIDDAISQLGRLGYADRTVVTAHPYVELRVGGVIPYDHPDTRRRIEQAEIGSLIVWESRLTGSEDHKLGVGEFLGSPAFREVLRTAPLPYQQAPYLYVFEKVASWGPRQVRVASPASQT